MKFINLTFKSNDSLLEMVTKLVTDNGRYQISFIDKNYSYKGGFRPYYVTVEKTNEGYILDGIMEYQQDSKESKLKLSNIFNFITNTHSFEFVGDVDIESVGAEELYEVYKLFSSNIVKYHSLGAYTVEVGRLSPRPIL